MLNLFPIQFLAPIAYFLLRVCLGVIALRLGMKHMRYHALIKDQFTFSFFPFPTSLVVLMSLVEILSGTLLILGLYTQVAALALAILSLKIILMHKRLSHPLIPPRMFYTLMLFVSLSLFITGAGILAFDLPI